MFLKKLKIKMNFFSFLFLFFFRKYRKFKKSYLFLIFIKNIFFNFFYYILYFCVYFFTFYFTPSSHFSLLQCIHFFKFSNDFPFFLPIFFSNLSNHFQHPDQNTPRIQHHLFLILCVCVVFKFLILIFILIFLP